MMLSAILTKPLHWRHRYSAHNFISSAGSSSWPSWIITLLLLMPNAAEAASARHVKRDMPTRLFVLAGFTSDCAFKDFPELQLDQAPTKGSVQFKQGETTTLQTTLSGNCVGSQLQGTGIYYTPTAGKVGEDIFTVTGRLGSGEPATKTFSIIIDPD